ncbi:hypothetical protein BAL199_22537 [alpha proteobacterium BAL199]|nr:hypothetical protein BAL199_22537 [alpha proteobacterium BAL199]
MELLQLGEFLQGSLSGQGAKIFRAPIRQSRDLAVTLSDCCLKRGDLAGDELAPVGDDLRVEGASVRECLDDSAWQGDACFCVERVEEVFGGCIFGGDRVAIAFKPPFIDDVGVE